MSTPNPDPINQPASAPTGQLRPQHQSGSYGDDHHTRSNAAALRRPAVPLIVVALFMVAILVLLIFGILLFAEGNGFSQLIGTGNAQPMSDTGIRTSSQITTASSAAEVSQIVQAAHVPPPGVHTDWSHTVGPRFADYYRNNGGQRSFGLPLGDPIVVNGREIQWFERARLEHWPEHAGTAYEVQPGLLGLEFTSGRNFPRQEFFVSRPDLLYFPETGHAVGNAFLRYWQANGALQRFGLPISEAFYETFPDGSIYLVQYFQRARLEYHPDFAGTNDEVMIGLLGSALLQNEQRPETIPPAPTTVPLR